MVTLPPVYLDTISMPDTLILMVLALVVFGPRRLPLIGRQIGKLMYEFRKASNDFKFQMEEELRQAEEADRRKKEEDERQRALAAAPPPAQIAAPAESAIQAEPSAEPAPPTEPPAANAADAPDSIAASREPVVESGTESVVESPITAATADAFSEPAVGITSESPDPSALAQPEHAAEPVIESPITLPSPESAPAAPTEAPLPRIQPPSTGEKVAAQPPGKRPAQGELFSADSGNAPERVAPEAEGSEPAAHHG